MHTIAKKTLYSTGFALFSLGYYRGFQRYYYNEIKRKNVNYDLKQFVVCNIFGIINGSIYINPALTGFALVDEYNKYKQRKDKNFDEQKYFSSSYFYSNDN